MPSPRLVVNSAEIRDEIASIRDELGLPHGFGAEVLSEAEAVAGADGPPSDWISGDRQDCTELPFVTIDPETSRDLDQALCIEKLTSGYRVHYAIADLTSFVRPGAHLDGEAHVRGQTCYAADEKVPLHPPVLSEGAASLLPDQTRPAYLWQLDLAENAELAGATVSRAWVRSRAKLSYAGVQDSLDRGAADAAIQLLAEVGSKRQALELKRGGVSLPLPEQHIHMQGDHWQLSYRAMLPVEQFNAQISLLTGMAAAELMIAGKVGVLRTLPTADPSDLHELRAIAGALDITWPEAASYAEFVQSLRPDLPAHAAMLTNCTRAFRGSGYLTFSGELPEGDLSHAAIAAPYAHVTAPLRRLADRYANEICVALAANLAVPQWALDALPELPREMADSSRRAGRYQSEVLNLIEAGLLSNQVGAEFAATVVGVDRRDACLGSITVADPAITSPVTSERPLQLGEAIRVQLQSASTSSRRVLFKRVR